MYDIIAPLNQDNYFKATLFYQYLGSEEGAEALRKYILPQYTDASSGVEYIYQTILDAFRIDLAVDVQLDDIGRVIGLPRPTQASVGVTGYFGFDDLPNLPFDLGEFSEGRTVDNSLVNNATYRRLIKIKIIKNVWDGTRVSLKALLHVALDADQIRIENENVDTEGACFSITFVSSTLTQEEADSLILLDLIPMGQGVRLTSVLVETP